MVMIGPFVVVEYMLVPRPPTTVGCRTDSRDQVGCPIAGREVRKVVPAAAAIARLFSAASRKMDRRAPHSASPTKDKMCSGDGVQRGSLLDGSLDIVPRRRRHARAAGRSSS